jgi:cytochrome c-type biogenesis protein CcmF
MTPFADEARSMLSGDTILVLAMLFYLIDFLAVLAKRYRLGLFSLVPAGLLSVAASFYFSWSFMRDNFALRAVYEQSSRSLAPLMKLSASWTGPGGSLLLWLLMMSVAMLIFRLKNRRYMNGERVVADLVQSFFTMAVLGFVLATNPFSELAAPVPDGLGLNPSLQTFFSTIHPPLVFAAYTTILLSYALVLGRTWAGERKSHQYIERIIWRSWMFLTLGIAIGGFWAYETLGWGGYWAWDPLETSALIPWLALTGLLFAKQIGLRRDLELFTTTFSASTLIFTVYIARSASVPSVHTYGDFIGGSAILLLAVVPVFLSFIAAKKRRGSVLDIRGDDFPSGLVFWSLTISASADFAILLYASLGPFLGLTFNPSRQVYNFPSMLMLTVFLAAIFVKCIKGRPSYIDAVLAFAFLLVIGAVLAFLKYPTGNFLTSLGLPFVLGLLVVAFYRIAKLMLASLEHFHLYQDIKYLAYFGISILLLGVLVSSSMAASTTASVPVGESLDAIGVKLSVVQMSTSPSAAQIFLPRSGLIPESIDTKILYTWSEDPSNVRVLVLKYYPALNQYVSTVSIDRSLTGDTYVVAGPTESVSEASALALKLRAPVMSGTPAEIRITVTKIPAISLVWSGIAILAFANLPFVFSANTQKRWQTDSTQEA